MLKRKLTCSRCHSTGCRSGGRSVCLPPSPYRWPLSRTAPRSYGARSRSRPVSAGRWRSSTWLHPRPPASRWLGRRIPGPARPGPGRLEYATNLVITTIRDDGSFRTTVYPPSTEASSCHSTSRYGKMPPNSIIVLICAQSDSQNDVCLSVCVCLWVIVVYR